MPSKKRLLSDCKLYVILDREVNSYPELFEIVRTIVPAGVAILQLRDKKGNAKDILDFSRRIRPFLKRSLYIINDRIDVALLAEADGVHLGQEDIPVSLARKMIGKNLIIGASCQTSAHARQAESQGADYIGFGSVFKTLTKPGREPLDLRLLKKVSTEVKIPVFAIGGITLKNAPEVLASGISRVAVCRDICLAKKPQDAVKKFYSDIAAKLKFRPQIKI